MTTSLKRATRNIPVRCSIFGRHGECGMWISELMPETAKHADRLCVINGMYADTGIHAQSFLQLHTGERLRPRPSLGSWINYGLGTENENMPGLHQPEHVKESPSTRARFLPSIHNGTPIGVNGEDMSLATIKNVSRWTPDSRRRNGGSWILCSRLNHHHLDQRPGDDELEERDSNRWNWASACSRRHRICWISVHETQVTLEQYRVGKKAKASARVVKPTSGDSVCWLVALPKPECVLSRSITVVGISTRTIVAI